MISRSRGYLPHVEIPQQSYFVTFRLEDSLPWVLMARWKEELQYRAKVQDCNSPINRRNEIEYQLKVHRYLDGNTGNCWLKDPRIAKLVDNTLRYFDGQRYVLHAWTIMPNHVHVLFTPSGSHGLSSIMHSWKSFTAHKANAVLGRSGRFWQPEYFDTLIKSGRQFEFYVRYILNNPVKAKLCKNFYEWPWSKCSAELQDLMKGFW